MIILEWNSRANTSFVISSCVDPSPPVIITIPTLPKAPSTTLEIESLSSPTAVIRETSIPSKCNCLLKYLPLVS